MLLFHRLQPDELEIHRAELADHPPILTEPVVEGEPPRDLRLSWSSEHDRPVTFNVFFWPDGRSPLLLASGLAENTLSVTGTQLPGPAGRFAVAASDGYRSAVSVGQPMTGFPVAIRIRITAPLSGSVLPPDQPINLAARAEDASGTTTGLDEMSWSIDGETVAQGPLTVTPAPLPGQHDIRATGVSGKIPIEADAISVTIAQRSAAQEEQITRLANLPPLEERRRETGT
jgi:hypothetical protein